MCEPSSLAGLRLALPEHWESDIGNQTDVASTSGREKLVAALAKAAGWDCNVRGVTATAIRFNGAFSNHVYKLQLLSGSGRSATYLLRLYGQEGDASRALVCKDDEIAAFVRLAGASLGPPLVATFANGRVEGWIEGRAITNARMRQCWQSVAEELARFHVLATAAARRPEASDGGVWHRLRRWLGLLNDAFPAGEDLPPAFREILGGAASAKGALAEEAAWLERLLGALPEDCFCHNDLQHGNIMALCQGGASGAAAPPADAAAGCAAEPTPPPPQLCFVDYEYAQFGPPQFDLANHFAECALWGSPAGWAYDYSDAENMVDFPGRFPSFEQRSAFVRHYLCARARHAGAEARGEPSEEAVREFLEAADCFVLVVHLLWVVWGLVQDRASSVEGFDYLEYSTKRLRVYASDKAALLCGGLAGDGTAGGDGGGAGRMGKNRFVARAKETAAAAGS